jgi:hypothetical protein
VYYKSIVKNAECTHAEFQFYCCTDCSHLAVLNSEAS